MSSPKVRVRVAAAAALWAVALAVNRSLRTVEGTSMAPTLLPGDRVLVVPVPPDRLRRGQLVTVRDPRLPARETIKRVLGLPGDDVAFAAGRLHVDGVARDEPYAVRATEPTRLGTTPGEDLLGPVRRGDGRWRVPAGHVFVAGDHRRGSTDSRSYGPVPVDHVTGLVGWRVHPWGPPGR